MLIGFQVIPKITIMTFCACLFSFTTSANWTVVVAAEDGEVTEPAKIVSANGAFGEKAVRISDTHIQPRIEPVQEPGDSALSRGTIQSLIPFPQKDTYHVWVRLQWHCTCSPYLEFRTTGESVVHDENRSGLISTNTRPMVWHWTKVGAFEFNTGMQPLTFQQMGHGAIIDTIAISSEETYRPPGYTEPDEVIHMKTPPKDWSLIIPANASLQYPLVENPISDFLLDITFPSPKNPQETTQRSLRFCDDSQGNFYELTLENNESGTRNAKVLKYTLGIPNQLAILSDLKGDSPMQSVSLVRLKETISVTLDGFQQFECSDNTLNAGMLSVVASGGKKLSFYDMELYNVESPSEYFNEGDRQWEITSGKWSVIKSEFSTENSFLYMGIAEKVGISLSPWLLTDNYSFTTLLQSVSPGRAGVAFDSTERNDGFSVVINTLKDETLLEIIRFENGNLESLWLTPIEAAEDQWHELQIVKYGARLNLLCNGVDMGSFEHSDWIGGGQTGLLIGDGAVARFSSVGMINNAFQRTKDFSFQANVGGGHLSLSQWGQEKGTFQIYDHPGRLEMKPRLGEQKAKLHLKRTLNLPAKISIWLQSGESSFKPVGLKDNLGLPEIILPVLPNDPRVGIELQCLAPGGPTYRFSVETNALRDLTLYRNGQEIAHKAQDLQQVGQGIADRLELIMGYDTLTASVPGRIEVNIPVSLTEWRNAKWQVSIVGENLKQDQVISLKNIYVDELPIQLGSTTGEL